MLQLHILIVNNSTQINGSTKQKQAMPDSLHFYNWFRNNFENPCIPCLVHRLTDLDLAAVPSPLQLGLVLQVNDDG